MAGFSLWGGRGACLIQGQAAANNHRQSTMMGILTDVLRERERARKEPGWGVVGAALCQGNPEKGLRREGRPSCRLLERRR